MFLTRMTLDTNRRGTRKLLASPQAMHAAVRAAFADPRDHERAGARTLWRVDTTHNGTVHLYVVSPGCPDLTHLVQQAGGADGEAWTTRGYTGLLESLHNGQQWAFRLTANPTHSGRKSADAKDTQRFGLLRAEEQTQWLAKQAARCGFTIAEQPDGEPNVFLRQRRNLTFKRGMGTVTLVTVAFEGLLSVTDRDAFREALTLGIGHGKAYGCGLLTIAPANP